METVAAVILIGGSVVLALIIGGKRRKPTNHVGSPCIYCREPAGPHRPVKCQERT